jgi:hypothetical protein
MDMDAQAERCPNDKSARLGWKKKRKQSCFFTQHGTCENVSMRRKRNGEISCMRMSMRLNERHARCDAGRQRDKMLFSQGGRIPRRALEMAMVMNIANGAHGRADDATGIAPGG